MHREEEIEVEGGPQGFRMALCGLLRHHKDPMVRMNLFGIGPNVKLLSKAAHLYYLRIYTVICLVKLMPEAPVGQCNGSHFCM